MKKEYLKEDLYCLAEIERKHGDDLKIESLCSLKSAKEFQAEVLLGFGNNSILADDYYVAINLDVNREVNSSKDKIFSGPYPLKECKKQFKEWCDTVMNIGIY